MKRFTMADVVNNNHLYVYSYELYDNPLPWQKQGLSQTQSGYGKKLTARSMIHFEGKLRRLYVTCFSNTGSTWFMYKGKHIFVN